MVHHTAHSLLTATAGAFVVVGVVAGCSGPAPEPTAVATASPASETPSASPSVAPSEPTEAEVEAAAIAEARAALIDSVTSGNSAEIANWVSTPVRVTIMGSEYQEDVSPAVAAVDVGNTMATAGAAVWNFSIPESTINEYRASIYYGTYFPEGVLVGVASSGDVIAFSMTGAQVTAILLGTEEQLYF